MDAAELERFLNLYAQLCAEAGVEVVTLAAIAASDQRAAHARSADVC